MRLLGFQRTHLRGLAHRLKPAVTIGQNGLSEGVIVEIAAALERHELIKVRFNAFKEPEHKRELSRQIEQSTDCEQVGMVGHMAIFYRQHPDPEQRLVQVPQRSTAAG